MGILLLEQRNMGACNALIYSDSGLFENACFYLFNDIKKPATMPRVPLKLGIFTGFRDRRYDHDGYDHGYDGLHWCYGYR